MPGGTVHIQTYTFFTCIFHSSCKRGLSYTIRVYYTPNLILHVCTVKLSLAHQGLVLWAPTYLNKYIPKINQDLYQLNEEWGLEMYINEYPIYLLSFISLSLSMLGVMKVGGKYFAMILSTKEM